jgi:choline dehydrogenase-like flavoprotein
VIGSGPAGLTTALELARLGVADVLVAERGDFLGFEHISRRTAKPRHHFSDVSWTATSTHFRQRPGVDGPVGGRSLCWEGVVMPINDATLRARWPTDTHQLLSGNGPGSYRAVLAALEAWKGASLTAPASPSDDVVANALAELNLAVPFSVVPNAAFSSQREGVRRWHVYSPLQAWSAQGLPAYSPAALPRIATGLRAKRLLIRGSDVYGAAFETPDGRTLEIRSGAIVLACGVLESTRLYAQALAEVDGQFIEIWPNLRDHIVHGVLSPVPDSLAACWQSGDRVFLYSGLTRQYNGNLFLEIHADRVPFPILDLWWIAQPEDPVSGLIRFQRSGEMWPGSIGAQLTVRDRSAIARRQAFTQDLLAKLGGPRFEPASRPTGYRRALSSTLAYNAVHAYINRLGSTEHESGTLPLGSHTLRGGQAAWSKNLFVAGTAVFPSSAAANPTLTIIALAQDTAREVAATLRQGQDNVPLHQ